MTSAIRSREISVFLLRFLIMYVRPKITTFLPYPALAGIGNSKE
jgi:hypothetical protein